MTEEDTPDDASFDEVPEEATESSADSRRAKKGGGAIAWLALLIALASAGGVGWDYLRDQSAAGDAEASGERLSELTASVNASQEILTTLEESVSALAALDEQRAAAIEQLENQLAQRLRSFEGLPGRVATVEAGMSALQGISTGARNAFLLAEAEYYLQIANAQLQLANNPELAMHALRHADERIVQLGDPRLTNVRQVLANELRALEAMETPDTAGITLTLTSLADSVDTLPLRRESVAPEAEGDDAAAASELTGMDRAWASVQSALDGVISVREVDPAVHPLTAPEAQYFLRANLSLQFQAARLALLRGEEALFQQSLDDADAWLATYYEADSAPVQTARETIAGIRDRVFRVAMPDISQSLRLLRQFNTLDEAATPAESDEATEDAEEQ